MPDLEDYNELADAWETLRPLIQDLMARSDWLGVEIPEVIGQGCAAILLLPAQLRAAAQGGPGWFTPDQETDDA